MLCIAAALTTSALVGPQPIVRQRVQRKTPIRAVESAQWSELINMASSLSETATLEAKILRVAATTSRGAASSDRDSTFIDDLVFQLEATGQPDVSTGALDGTWLLAYSSCPAYRTSPFFWAFEKLAGDATQPLLSITDGLPFYRVGVARQTFSDTASISGTLVSAIEVSLSVFDALLPPVRSVMTTTAGASPDAADPAALVIDVQTTEVKESSLPFSDVASFPTKEVFDQLKAGAAQVSLRTSYLSSTMRITRAPDGAVLVYVRE